MHTYLDSIIQWENKFAQPGVAYDAATGYTYDGHPLNYDTGDLYGDPHLFSASSKESIHMAVLALALDGNELALKFAGGRQQLLSLLSLKMKGYMQFNTTFPGFGCFTPWVTFSEGNVIPLPDWANKVPGLDNGEWFWSLYAIADILTVQSNHDSNLKPLAEQYRALIECQMKSAKTIFYRGDGKVSDVATIKDASIAPVAGNYEEAANGGYLNDPYEGETMTLLLYLFADWSGDEPNEREKLWEAKRPQLVATSYSLPTGTSSKSTSITVQRGYWFSSHEQWKLLLLPYANNQADLPLVHRLFANAERVRTWDATLNNIPGLMASVNDVSQAGPDQQSIPDYSSACGIAEVSSQKIERRDLLTPYGSFALGLFDVSTALCWYNNMLSAPRMQSPYGSVEAVNVNGTEISPLTTWDAKITTVLGLLGGIGELNKRALQRANKYADFVTVIKREYDMVFGRLELQGEDLPFAKPNVKVPEDQLSDWELTC